MDHPKTLSLSSIAPLILSSSIALIVAVAFLTPLAGILSGMLMDYYPGVIDKMTSCNKTEELLGENPRLAWFGLSYGFAKVEGSYGRVSWRFPVKGDDARGSFSFFMERHGGSWEMIGGNVKSGDETLGITTCRYQEKVEIPQIK